MGYITLCCTSAGSRLYPALKMPDIHLQLSPREKQVLNRLAAGLSNKEIAFSLKISEYTVKNHVRSILGKLSVKTRGQAVAKAANLGLLKLSPPEK